VTHIRQTSPFRWEGVPVRPYRDDGTQFQGITRQVLFERGDAELRYFELAPRGYSSLERHEHEHSVMVVLGRGRCLVGREVHELGTGDLVSVPPSTWHQFRAADEPLGFLCLVSAERDRPEQPGAAALAELRADERVAGFIRT
jgi:quercetin dioxygenase-like cupin family protein